MGQWELVSGTGFASNWSRDSAAMPRRAREFGLPRDHETKKRPACAGLVVRRCRVDLFYWTATGAGAVTFAALSALRAFAALRGAVSKALRASPITVRIMFSTAVA